MHYTGLTFRPPYEANSLLLQVTKGCSHNACTFCIMYKDTPFEESPLDEIEEDLIEASAFPYERRVFLENGDAFSLSTERLLTIAKMIRAHLPYVREITGYARVDNIASKTDEELSALARAGFCDINIGIESALDDVLTWMNKGYDCAEARKQMLRLRKAGISFSVNIINAAAGPDRILEHAQANAALLNEVQPYLIFVSPLHVDPGSAIEANLETLGFEECTLRQYLEEEMALLEHMEMENCIFFGLHVSNPVGVIGRLPQDKNRLLHELKAGMKRIPDQILDSHPQKGSEGRLQL